MKLTTNLRYVFLFASLVTGLQTGCIMSAQKYVPASRVPHQLLAQSKSDKVPINLTLLGQPTPPSYIVGPGDVLGVYVQGVLPAKIDDLPIVSGSQSLSRDYYPPKGNIQSPAAGVPIQVQDNGQLPLPLVNGVQVQGQSMEQAAEAIRKAYLGKGILQEGRDRIYVVLVRPRTTRVLVIREDIGTDIPQQMRKDSVVYSRRGRAETLDLPAFENDVLHALTATGGLPGIDAYNEVWVLRGSRIPGDVTRDAKNMIDAGDVPDHVLESLRSQMTATRIPLRHCCNQPIPFNQHDVLLHPGDIVFIAPREQDYFYTGGLLPGGQIPLPRDHDVDVVEALALAQGSVGGPGGVSSASIFRTGAGLGNVVPPTRLLIVRKLPGGQTLPIRVDLATAMLDPKERIIVQPGDMLMLQYKPSELTGNFFLNFFNWNFTGLYTLR